MYHNNAYEFDVAAILLTVVVDVGVMAVIVGVIVGVVVVIVGVISLTTSPVKSTSGISFSGNSYKNTEKKG